MKVKIDTKEKFHIIRLNESTLSANMTEELSVICLEFLSQPLRNLVLDLTEISSLELKDAEAIATIQQQFYDSNASFVICSIQPQVEKFLDDNQLLELMNVTPTESEAWDILQMEEMERELLNEENDD